MERTWALKHPIHRQHLPSNGSGVCVRETHTQWNTTHQCREANIDTPKSMDVFKSYFIYSKSYISW